MYDTEPKFKLGDRVRMYGYNDPGHPFYGLVATIIDYQQFRKGRWEALLEYIILGETKKVYFPDTYLEKAE